MGPAGVPPSITARLTREVKTILTSAEVKTHFANNAMDIDYRDPKEFAVFMNDEIKRWKGVVSKANRHPDVISRMMSNSVNEAAARAPQEIVV